VLHEKQSATVREYFPFSYHFVAVVATGKNPDVDTSFLPDRDREEEDARLRFSITLHLLRIIAPYNK